jgi:aminoglycoside 3-N-acetyltransferase
MKLKTFVKRLIPLLPARAQVCLRDQNKKSQRRARSKRERTLVHVVDVLHRISECELAGDFMIHGSITNIGKLDKPVSELMKGWIEQIDLTRQTILCPALPYNTTMLEYLKVCKDFDVHSAKNAMGAISNSLMAMPGAVRSLHPTHSVVALGASASEYVAQHELDSSPFGPNSPYQKLTLRGGKIVMFGVGLNSVTCFHVYEDMMGSAMPLPIYLDQRFTVPCKGPTGNITMVTTSCHNPSLSAIRECERARGWLVEAGALKTYTLGDSELSVLDARLFTVTLLKMLAEGKSIYGDIKLTPIQQQRAAECRKVLD